jgi:hypothetical protein
MDTNVSTLLFLFIAPLHVSTPIVGSSTGAYYEIMTQFN